MANPQVEDGFLKLSLEFLDALCRVRISGEASQVFLYILRKTWGWKKKSDAIPLSQFVQATGITKRNVIRARKKLAEMNLITVLKTENDSHVTYMINKDFDTWKPFSVSRTPKTVLNSENAFSVSSTTVLNSENASFSVSRTKTKISTNKNAHLQPPIDTTSIDTYKRYSKRANTTGPIQSRKKPSPIPVQFELSEKMLSWAKQDLRLDEIEIELQTENFIDRNRASNRTSEDWHVEWKIWMRRQASWNGQKKSPGADITDEELNQKLEDILGGEVASA